MRVDIEIVVQGFARMVALVVIVVSCVTRVPLEGEIVVVILVGSPDAQQWVPPSDTRAAQRLSQHVPLLSRAS